MPPGRLNPIPGVAREASIVTRTRFFNAYDRHPDEELQTLSE